MDPCAQSHNALCSRYFTAKEDGLKQSWKGHRAFVNPPYGRGIKEWVKNKERKLFMDLCDKWYSEYYTKTEVIIQPTFMEAFEECRKDLAETKHDSWTAGRWTNIGENIQQYMDIRKKDIKNIKT